MKAPRTLFLFSLAICLVLLTEAGYCITCEECREIERNKAQVQTEMTRKEKELERHLQRRDVRLLQETRRQINDLRRNLIGLKGHDEECRTACKPDVLKEAECLKLMEQIVTLESQGSEAQADLAKMDALYVDLSRCNQDLRKLKEAAQR